ncbi:hypothetical protein SAMN04487819_11320 [Actinopolyspora alba]|uniref:Uncharacterized protein n=1 Tax=Actinopolyspora alba TaxID=673379 RepID=A0A1I2ABK9_9ACTN|nr:hypothetical protein SAMN04487819_11320 [Actinopolyspora alba]
MTRLLVAVASLCLAAALSIGVLSVADTSASKGSGSAFTPVAMHEKRAFPPPESRVDSPPRGGRRPRRPPRPTRTRHAARGTPAASPQPAKNSLDIEYQPRKTSYWCGPAAARWSSTALTCASAQL